MWWTRLIIVLLLSISSMGANQRRDERVSVFVGPPLRDGFVDAKVDVLDSIKDVQDALKKSRALLLVQKQEDATVVVTVVNRRIAGAAGGVGVPVGGLAVLVPINSRAIEWTLRVGTYETQRTSEDRDHDNWRSVANALVKDLTAWVDANRGVLVARP